LRSKAVREEGGENSWTARNAQRPCVGCRTPHGFSTASHGPLKADGTVNEGKRNVKSGIVRAVRSNWFGLAGLRVICTDQYIAIIAPAAKQALMRIPARLPGQESSHPPLFFPRKICLCFRSFSVRIRIS
jgi:hypothetical protein